jgi:hypothetical protein
MAEDPLTAFNLSYTSLDSRIGVALRRRGPGIFGSAEPGFDSSADKRCE